MYLCKKILTNYRSKLLARDKKKKDFEITIVRVELLDYKLILVCIERLLDCGFHIL